MTVAQLTGPSHDLDAEKSILGAILLKPSAIAEVSDRLAVDDFFLPAHREIFEAMLALRDKGTPVDVLLLADELRGRAALPQLVGGERYLVELAEGVPTAENVAHYVDIVRRHRGLRLWDELRSQRFGSDVNTEDLARGLEAIRSRLEPNADRAIYPLAEDPAWLNPSEDPDEYLIEHKDLGGLLLRGTTGLIASGGGVGKTWLMMTLAVMVAAGRKEWGPLRLRSWGGLILLLLREGSYKSLRKRLVKIMGHFDLTADERKQVERRLVLPRLDLERSVRLQEQLSRNRSGTDDESPYARRLLGSLRRRQWDLIVFDPLVKFAGPEAETDNAAGDRLHDIFARFTGLPGNPTVLVTHHMTKEALKPDAPTGSFSARGSSSLTNGFRFQANLLKKDGSVELTIPKQNDGVELTGDTAIMLSRTADGLLVHEARVRTFLPGVGR
jgi:hypothetical protein